MTVSVNGNNNRIVIIEDSAGMKLTHALSVCSLLTTLLISSASPREGVVNIVKGYSITVGLFMMGTGYNLNKREIRDVKTRLQGFQDSMMLTGFIFIISGIFFSLFRSFDTSSKGLLGYGLFFLICGRIIKGGHDRLIRIQNPGQRGGIQND